MLRRYTNLRPEHLKLVVFAPRRQQMFLAKGESSNSAVFEAAMELVVEDPSLDGAPRFRGTQIGGLEFTSLRTYWREEPPKRCCWRNFRGYRRRCSRRLGSTWPFDLEVLSAGRLRLVLQADGLHQAERRRLPQPYPRIFRVQRAKVGVEGSNHFTVRRRRWGRSRSRRRRQAFPCENTARATVAVSSETALPEVGCSDMTTSRSRRASRLSGNPQPAHSDSDIRQQYPNRVMSGRPPRGKKILTVRRGGRVQSCLRPVDAAHMTAGPDEVCGSVPCESRALKAPTRFRAAPIPVSTGSPSCHHHLTLSWNSKGCALSRHGGTHLEFLSSAQHRPGDPSHFVGHPDRRHHGGASGTKGRDPASQSRPVGLAKPHHGRCSDHQQAPQIGLTLFRDPAEPLLASARVLTRHQPDPGCELAARFEDARISDGGGQCARDDRPHTRGI